MKFVPATPACLHSFLSVHPEHDSPEQAKTLLAQWDKAKLMSEVGALSTCPAHYICCPYMQFVSELLLTCPFP